MDKGDLIGAIDKGGIDAYVQIDHNSKKFRTKTITAKVQETQDDFCADVVWNQEFWLTCRMPVLEPYIYLRVMDHDDLTSDEMVGTIAIKTADLVNAGPDGFLKWYQVWGSPLGQSDSKERTLMNKNPDYATTFKGRILMEMCSE